MDNSDSWAIGVVCGMMLAALVYFGFGGIFIKENHLIAWGQAHYDTHTGDFTLHHERWPSGTK